MQNGVKRKTWGFVIVGLVGVLSLGAIGIAGAASGTKSTPSPTATAQAGGVHTPDGDRDGHIPDGDHDGRGGHGGGGDLAEATKIETAELDAAVKASPMTEAERTRILAGLQAHLSEELTETHALPGDGDHDGRGGHGGHGGTVSPSTGGAALTS